MKGSGVAASKAKASSKRPSAKPQQEEISQNILPPQAVLPVGFEPDPEFSRFKDLPVNVPEEIIKRGMESAVNLRPGEKLQFAIQETPGLAINKEFLLPKKLTVYFLKGTQETKSFNTFAEYKSYLEELINNIETNKFDIIDINNEYINVRINMFKESTSGSIIISIYPEPRKIKENNGLSSYSKSTNRALGQLSLQFERFKKKYDDIRLSKILLSINITPESEKNAHLDSIAHKDFFVGIRWLFLLFKKISWDKKIIDFSRPENINVYYYDYNQLYPLKLTYKDLEEKMAEKLLKLLEYIELNLNPPKPKSSRRPTRI